MPEGFVDSVTRESVMGWAFDPVNKEAKLEVCVFVDGRQVGRCTADLPRENFTHKHFPTRGRATCGFMYKFAPPLSQFLQQIVEVRYADTATIVPGGRQQLDCPAAVSLQLKPVIVSARGRSGTTLLMKHFSEHSEIAVANAYPFEIKLAAYYVSAYRTLTATKYPAANEPDFAEFAAEKQLIGPNPFNNPNLHRLIGGNKLGDIFNKDIQNGYVSLFRKVIVDFYHKISEQKDNKNTRFFAEKADLDREMRLGLRMLLGPLHEIVLVRDPRDLLCSAKAFWKMNKGDALRTVAKAVDAMRAIHKAAAPDTMFVRYEDLIQSPNETLRSVYRFLGATTIDEVKEQGDLHRIHATTVDPRASIGRWQRDLTPNELFACLDQWTEFMKTFGYLDATPGRSVPISRGKYSAQRYVSLNRDAPRKVVHVNDIGHIDLPTLRNAGRQISFGFGESGGAETFLGDGWSVAEQGYRWSAAATADLVVPAPTRPGSYIFDIFVRPFVLKDKAVDQEIIIKVNDVRIGHANIGAPAVLRFGVSWDVIRRNDVMKISFEMPKAARPADLAPRIPDRRLLGFAFESLAIFGPGLEPTTKTGPEVPEMGTESVAAGPRGRANGADRNTDQRAEKALLEGFESLGENCEFGLVQRRCGAEPLGLLRFSSTPFPALLKALRGRFIGMGAAGTLDVRVSGTGREYMIHDSCFGFLYHAWVNVGELAPSDILKRELQRLPLLIRKLSEDLAEGAKIFVFHGMTPLTEAQARDLSAAVRGYGPGTVLWVELADVANPPGSVRWIAPGLLKGHMDRFAPGDNAHNLSLDCWIAVCRGARLAVTRPALVEG